MNYCGVISEIELADAHIHHVKDRDRDGYILSRSYNDIFYVQGCWKSYLIRRFVVRSHIAVV